MEEFVPFASRSYGLMFLLLFVSRGMDFLSTWVATPNMVLEGNPIAKKLGWKWGIPLNCRALFRLRLLAAAGHCHQHDQCAGRRAQFPIRLADALAGRAALPRLARRARPGNQRHALPVLPVCPNRADRRGGRGGDLFQRVAAGAAGHRAGHRGLRAGGRLLHPARHLAHAPFGDPHRPPGGTEPGARKPPIAAKEQREDDGHSQSQLSSNRRENNPTTTEHVFAHTRRVSEAGRPGQSHPRYPPTAGRRGNPALGLSQDPRGGRILPVRVGRGRRAPRALLVRRLQPASGYPAGGPDG